MRSLLATIVFVVFATYGAWPLARGVTSEPPAPATLQLEKRLLDGSEIGVLFPTFGDFDSDGKIDLLVGVTGLGQGRLREQKAGEGGLLVHLNRGTNAAPEYGKPFWFDKIVPSGRIPRG